MSAAIFHSELSSLIQESKKKFPDLRGAAEKSLGDLKALRITSEAQLAGDLRRKSAFAEPFILACNSRNAKLIISAVICLQRLIASHALPSQRLRDVLGAFREVASSNFDVQIKILQTLPSLLQIYSSDVYGELLFTSLEICGVLQSSKVTVLSSTASATFQQLISSAFERLANEDRHGDVEVIKEISLGNGKVALTQARTDALEIFNDLCGASDGAGPKNFGASTISAVFALDLLTAILVADDNILRDHAELLSVCRERLLPLLIGRLSTKSSFPVTIRSLIILFLLVTRHLGDFKDESEAAFGLLTHVIETDSSPEWKRAACAEILRKVISDVALLRTVFDTYDLQDERKNIVGNIMAAYARIAAERPALIGLGHQSTLPARQDHENEEGQEQASLETSGIEGVIGSAVTADAYVIGISAAWSIPKAPCIEQLDKNDIPSLSDTYLYAIVLDCLSSLSEGLAKSIMPMSLPRLTRKKSQPQPSEVRQDPSDTVPDPADGKNVALQTASDSQKARQVMNPLKRTDHPEEQPIKTLASIITSCWPAFLATCATLLNATLDAEFYHNLVRAMQKFAQAAGALELSTPRDALLTALGKAAIPAQALHTVSAGNVGEGEPNTTSPKVDTAASHALGSPSKSVVDRGSSIKAGISTLTFRNLLCLRALLNLGIALGPTLSQEAWFILLESLQQAEYLINLSSRLLVNQRDRQSQENPSIDPSGIRTSLGGEVAAVQTASKKMLASTAYFENEVFLSLLKALLSLSASTESLPLRNDLSNPTANGQSRRTGRMHQSARSVSGTSSKAAAEDDEVLFVLSKMSEVARSNLQRFARESVTDSGLTLITESLLSVMKSKTTIPAMQIRIAALINSILLGTLEVLDDQDKSLQENLQQSSFSILRRQIDGLYQHGPISRSEHRDVDHQVHERVIETLTSIVEKHGENLFLGWAAVFELVGSIFEEVASPSESDQQQHVHREHIRARSSKLLTSSFRLVQLIGSDFLTLLAVPHLLSFINTVLLFGRQQDDLNISLTSTTFFRNIADFLHTRKGHFSLEFTADIPTDELLVRRIADSSDLATTLGPLWLILLLRLGSLTTDSRSEVRKSAITIVLQIVDSSGPTLSPHGWYVCLSLILLPLFKSHGSLLAAIGHPTSKPDIKSMQEWHSSTVALVEGGLKLLAKYALKASVDNHFLLLWNHIFESVESVLDCPALAVSSAVFRGVAVLFSALKETNHLEGQMAIPALRLWIQRHPANSVTPFDTKEGPARPENSNQVAFSAHGELLICLYDALPSLDLDEMGAEDVLQSLKKTVWHCIHPPYTSDVLQVATEQGHVISSLELLSKTQASQSREYLTTVLEFVQIALKDDESLETESRGSLPARQRSKLRNGQIPTFVAFSSACMDILQRDVIRMIRNDATASEPTLIADVLDALSGIMSSKYTVRAHRGDPLLWHKATTSSLGIIEAVTAQSDQAWSRYQPSALKTVYASSIEIVGGILGSGKLEYPNEPSEKVAVIADEDHDLKAFGRLTSKFIPALARLENLSATDQQVGLDLQRKFVICLLHASMITVPHFGDLPSDDDLVRLPLSSFRQVRLGTVKQPVFYVRDRIAYLAVDTLFKLTAASESERDENSIASEGRKGLAIVAAPYLLLRAAHTLKSFVADQPLRGPMPMLCRLRAEMIYILRLCLELRSDDKAFVETSQSSFCPGRDGKGHLRVLYPLILLVWKTWNRIPRYGMSWTADKDGIQLEGLLHQWMEACGEKWVLPDSISESGLASF